MKKIMLDDGKSVLYINYPKNRFIPDLPDETEGVFDKSTSDLIELLVGHRLRGNMQIEKAYFQKMANKRKKND